MARYDHIHIEKKWQERWERDDSFQATENIEKKKFYALIEFPYPSGAGLHTGHIRSYTALDAVVRKRRRENQEVLFPIGWDAFGLPTENYAIKTGRKPKEITKENTDTFRRQLKSIGLSFDWKREINTTDPSYYKWTQWIFLQLFKKGLAYKSKTEINWCPKDKIGLANEEVIDGKCERCGTEVEKREKEQWMLAITKYAKRLYDDLHTVDYIERAKIQQQNWIGPSEGSLITFPLVGISGQQDGAHSVQIFTTRSDTIYGATFVVVSPELAKKWMEMGWQIPMVASAYVNETLKERAKAGRKDIEEKTGVDTGIFAINPGTKERIPVWISNYILGDVGTGAIMAVPSHDERDNAFAKKFGLPISRMVVVPQKGSASDDLSHGDLSKIAQYYQNEYAGSPFTGHGIVVNSGAYDGLTSEEAKRKITEDVGGILTTKYKLRDWVFSRQRYWGEPIPLVYCESCAEWIPVPEDELPITLPEISKYEYTDTGESPLANIAEWVNTTCPKCNGPARRETDTMPNWAGSSWYYLRYTDPKNDTRLADSKKLSYWTPVDWYNGGMEHTVLHLLYSRFWHKFLFDIGVAPTSEPYTKRTSHGLILAEGGEKMSKSKGNVVNPDDIVERFGADALRVYEMFMGPFEQAIAWSTDGLVGTRRFLERVYALAGTLSDARPSDALSRIEHQSIKKIGEDIEALKMNTAVSQLMIFQNAISNEKKTPKSSFETFLLLLAPFAPHITEELWEMLGHTTSIHKEPWPTFNPDILEIKEASVSVMVDGKVRGSIVLSVGISKEEAFGEALKLETVKKWVDGKTPKTAAYVPGKIISLTTNG